MISELTITDLDAVTGGNNHGFSLDISHSFNTGGTYVYGSVTVTSSHAGGNTVVIGSSGGLNINVLLGVSAA
jgi:hypothetical protein